MARKPTIRDVAREAGVSVATVSRVLNNRPDTAEETRQLVERAIRTLGYARSSQWHQITTGRSRAISLLFPYTESSPSHINLDFITGVAAACEERGYRLDLITRPVDKDDLLDLYRSSKSDGTILMKVQLHDERVDLLRNEGFPFVMIGHTENPSGASFIDYDFEAAMRVAMAHLTSLGHRHIGYVSPMPAQHRQHGPTVRASRAYLQACEDLDLPSLHYETDQSLRHIQLMTTKMLHDHPEMTALVTMREMVETALYFAVHDAGFRIPEDFSVLGLMTPDGPELTSPALTALDFPAWPMAYEAGTTLIDVLEDVDTSVKEVLWEPTLTVRASTGPARRAP